MSNQDRIRYTEMLSSGQIQAASIKFGKKTWVDPIEGVDVDAEYALIQAKKSTLSKRDRGLVVLKWERIQARKNVEQEK